MGIENKVCAFVYVYVYVCMSASSLGRVSANLPEDLSGRQSAEAEALERHTVFSTRVRAEALEQQKAEALKQQEAEALERQRLEAAASGSQSAEAATRPQASPVAKAPRSSPSLCSPSIARNPNVSET